MDFEYMKGSLEMITEEQYLKRIKEKEEYFISLIRTKAEQIGRVPYQYELGENYYLWWLIPYDQLVIKAGYTPLKRKTIPDEELLAKVINKAKELGRTPRPTEVKEYQTMISRWGTWNKILELTNLKPLPPKRQPKYTDYELIDIVIQIRTTFHRQGREFSRKNYEELWKSSKYLPSASTLVQRLGGWKNLKKLTSESKKDDMRK